MERIHVSVRARPLSGEDAKSSPWRISSNSIFIPNHSSKFDFDHIFSDDCKTLDVYLSRTKEIVGAAVKGFNGTVFAYGQTNSGKTYTMRGSESEPGVIPLAVRDLFATINQDVDREFLLRMSYMEIYNEEINDLLVPEHRKLQIHESIERGIFVAGLREEIVVSPDQVLAFMAFGESHRHVGETNMNIHSSRSHTIFRMIIESRDKTEDGVDIGDSCDSVRVSVLNLVDLAGSERAAKTGAEGLRLKEGSHINRSLMTLGTVIKKLSEGAESQGGHVPYRDSKLTRILQSALGGNANTGIICNITLAQIHADETKSSLQFASRALRVKNCAHVNEILTDAALLKRQKKEIEVLRAKLQGSHSEHSEEEILNLRNTLLQTELERERIALELEEERKAQVEYEKMVQEQAKKIENLSSMVLISNREEYRDRTKKDKRRGTWCPSNLSREIIEEVDSSLDSTGSAIRGKNKVGPLVPFKDLMDSIAEEETSKEDGDCTSNASEDYKFPDPCALLHITSRRKPGPTKKENEATSIKAEYDDLLARFESQRMEIDSLTRRPAEFELLTDDRKDCPYCSEAKAASHEDRIVNLKDSESVAVIQRLKEEIKRLEIEKASSQQNVVSTVELATEQTLCAQEKLEDVYGKLHDAREENKEGNSSYINKLLTEVRDVISEVQDSKIAVDDTISLLLDEASKTYPSLFETFHDFKTSICQNSHQIKEIIANHDKLNSCLMQKVSKLENEKSALSAQSAELQNQIEELTAKAENTEQYLSTLLGQHDQESEEYLCRIQTLERDLSSISSCSMAKENENLRKDLDKTKARLKDAEFKLKNAIQEKTKLEGAKASAEREIKRLNIQNSLLERDNNKRDSLAGRRHESIADKSLKVCDPKNAKGLYASSAQAMQEEQRKMEVHVFEMGSRLASVEEEKEEYLFRNKELASDLESLSEKLNTSDAALNVLRKEVSELRKKLEDSESELRQMRSSTQALVEEKEEQLMQLSDSLLEAEEEKAVWSAKEKAAVEAIEEKARLYNIEIASLSKELSEVRNALKSRTQDWERLRCDMEIKNSSKKISDIDQPQNGIDLDDVKIKQSHEEMDMLQKDLNSLKKEREELLIQIRDLQTKPDLSHDLQCLKTKLLCTTEERDKLKTQMEAEAELMNKRCNDVLEQAKLQETELTMRISSMQVKMQENRETNIQLVKHKMRLHWTQAKLDAFRERYSELVAENGCMNKSYQDAVKALKEKLASKGIEVLDLKKQLISQQHNN